MDKKMKVTRRWTGAFKDEGMEDIVEMNDEYYRLVNKNYKTSKIEEYYKTGHMKDKYTIKDLLANKKAGSTRAGDMIEIITSVELGDTCCCGGASTSKTHSWWCPKYTENWK